MPTTTFIAQPTLKIDGSAAPSELMDDILQIVVEESLHLPGMFTLVIRNDYYGGATDHKVWKHEALFEIGKSIDIGFSANTTESDKFSDENKGNVIKGEITAIETHFTNEAQAPIIVRGYDASHRLHRGRHNRSFQNKTDADIVKSIASEVGIAIGTIDATGGPYGYGDIGGASGYVFQQNQTNMEFLRERAARNGFELFVQDGKLYFRKPKQNSTLELEWLTDIHSFRVRVSSAEQMQRVEVRGWDYSRKEVIAESASSTQQVLTTTAHGAGLKTVSRFEGKPTTPTLIMVDQPISQAKEAKTMAQALFDELGGEFVQADARGSGDPSIRPGRVVKLTGMGKYSGSYYVTETRQLFHERIYTTEFSVRGLRGGDLLQTLEARNTLQPGQTLMVGIVADNNDPKGWGRVRVKIPTLTEDHMSNWARVVSIGAGPSRGLDWLPEIDDEVLVAFEHGDIHRPYILGGIWNGKDAPPEKTEEVVANGKVRLRTIKTRVGHTLQFVEEDKGTVKKGIYLTTVDQQHLSFNDADQSIELKTKDGYVLRLDDKEKSAEITSKDGHKLKISDAKKLIELATKGGCKLLMNDESQNVDLRGGDVTITGTTNITLNVGSNKIVLSTSGIDITGTQVNIQANATAKLEGSVVDVKGQGTVNVQSSGMTKVAGSVVKLN